MLESTIPQTDIPQTKAPTRATSLADMAERMYTVFNADGEEAWRAFQPRPSDVIISPYGKSGTTWLQQIVHGLRTGGDMDFDDISRVVPWIETSYALGIDLNAEQRGHPRAFKSHLAWDDVPKGGRYIVSIRDPKDAFVSRYHFMQGWLVVPGSIPMSEWANDNFARDRQKSGYWRHLLSWWEHRQDENVLLLCYETMKTDLPGTIRRVAQFIGVALDDRLFDTVLRQSSFDFMLAHKDKFDERLMSERMEKVAGLPPGGDSTKVRKGKVGEHVYELSDEIIAQFDQAWREEIEAKLGFASYAALRSAIR